MLKPIAETMGQVQARVDTTAQRDRAAVSGAHALVDGPSVPGWSELTRTRISLRGLRATTYIRGLIARATPEGVVPGDSNRVAAFLQGFLARRLPQTWQLPRPPARTCWNRGHAPSAANGTGQPAPNGHQPPARVTLEQLRLLAEPMRRNAPRWQACLDGCRISQFTWTWLRQFRGRTPSASRPRPT